MAGHEKSTTAQNGLPQKDGYGDCGNGRAVFNQHLGVDQHTHRYEEDGAKQVFYRSYHTLYALGFDRLGQNTSHHKGTERCGIAGFIGQYHQQKTQTDSHDKQRFAVHQRTGLFEHPRDEIDAHDKPQHQEEA